MDLSRANTEPMAGFVAFHNRFNRNIKVAVGGLDTLSQQVVANPSDELPRGSEPWGRVTKGRNFQKEIEGSFTFISELGLARTFSAFEDYLVGATAEFDRAQLAPIAAPPANPTGFDRIAAMLGADGEEAEDIRAATKFFEIARNCVVHRSNRASSELIALSASKPLKKAIERWPGRQKIWRISLPEMREDAVVNWLPRHAILASDAYYRAACLLDRLLIQKLGPDGMVQLATHWCFFADEPVACPAKLNPETMIRTQLVNRYKTVNPAIPEIVEIMKRSGKWTKVRDEFVRRAPTLGGKRNGPYQGVIAKPASTS